MIENLINIIDKVRARITDGSDMVWTRYDNAEALRRELEVYIQQLKLADTICLDSISLLFAPTGTLHEHSISNGWSDEYMELSERVDYIFMALKKEK